MELITDNFITGDELRELLLSDNRKFISSWTTIDGEQLCDIYYNSTWNPTDDMAQYLTATAEELEKYPEIKEWVDRFKSLSQYLFSGDKSIGYFILIGDEENEKI